MIHKTTLTVTILHRETDPFPQSLSLADVANKMDDGEYLGTTCHTATVPIADENDREECLTLGNDGDFFDEFA